MAARLFLQKYLGPVEKLRALILAKFHSLYPDTLTLKNDISLWAAYFFGYPMDWDFVKRYGWFRSQTEVRCFTMIYQRMLIEFEDLGHLLPPGFGTINEGDLPGYRIVQEPRSESSDKRVVPGTSFDIMNRGEWCPPFKDPTAEEWSRRFRSIRPDEVHLYDVWPNPRRPPTPHSSREYRGAGVGSLEVPEPSVTHAEGAREGVRFTESSVGTTVAYSSQTHPVRTMTVSGPRSTPVARSAILREGLSRGFGYGVGSSYGAAQSSSTPVGQGSWTPAGRSSRSGGGRDPDDDDDDDAGDGGDHQGVWGEDGYPDVDDFEDDPEVRSQFAPRITPLRSSSGMTPESSRSPEVRGRQSSTRTHGQGSSSQRFFNGATQRSGVSGRPGSWVHSSSSHRPGGSSGNGGDDGSRRGNQRRGHSDDRRHPDGDGGDDGDGDDGGDSSDDTVDKSSSMEEEDIRPVYETVSRRSKNFRKRLRRYLPDKPKFPRLSEKNDRHKDIRAFRTIVVP